MKYSSQFITLEGIEGAGKSTVASFIQNFLLEKKIKVVMTREPGGTPLAEKIRDLLLHDSVIEPISATTELLLLFAGRAQHIQQVLIPALNAGKWVISDRYIDASYAYQKGGRQMDEKMICWLDEFVVKDVYPNLTLLLDISPELGLSRAQKRNSEKDRIEREQVDFFARVRAVYLERAAADPKRIKVINSNLSLDQVKAQVKHELEQYIMSI